MARFNRDGAVTLYYDNAAKFATTSTGVDITGTLTSDGLTVDGTFNFTSAVNGIINNPASFFINIDSDNNNAGEAFYISRDAENTAGARVAKFDATGDISFYEDTGTTPKFFWDASAESLGIGTSTPAQALVVNRSSGNTYLEVSRATQSQGQVALQLTGGTGGTNWIMYQDTSSNDLKFFGNSADRMTIDSSGNVGIGTSSPTGQAANNRVLQIYGAGTNDRAQIHFANSATGEGTSDGSFIGVDTTSALYIINAENAPTIFENNGSERMRIDSSGNLLVGTTDTNPADDTSAGYGLAYNIGFGGSLLVKSNNNATVTLNRTASDGDILAFRKDGTPVGSIGTFSSDLYIGTNDSGLRFEYAGLNAIVPFDVNSSATSDAATDLGNGSARFKDLYATNGTIQTSDQNEKQQIASLTGAEITAAKAISKLFKTFKWNDSVTEKGDAARTHTGVIAQEVEQAMTDAGLNAGDYAFFISSDWTDEDTGEERNRKGIRYPQLMSFIGAATEQRLTSIEARLDALEGV